MKFYGRIIFFVLAVTEGIPHSDAYSWSEFSGAVSNAYAKVAQSASGFFGNLKTAVIGSYSTVLAKLEEGANQIESDAENYYVAYQQAENIYPNVSQVRFFLYSNPA